MPLRTTPSFPFRFRSLIWPKFELASMFENGAVVQSCLANGHDVTAIVVDRGGIEWHVIAGKSGTLQVLALRRSTPLEVVSTLCSRFTSACRAWPARVLCRRLGSHWARNRRTADRGPWCTGYLLPAPAAAHGGSCVCTHHTESADGVPVLAVAAVLDPARCRAPPQVLFPASSTSTDCPGAMCVFPVLAG